MNRLRLGITLVISSLVSIAAYGVQPPERDVDWVAPQKAASKPNPLVNRPEAEAGGRKIFQQRCVTCHGDAGHGTTKGPALTAPDAQSQSDGALFWKISGGNTRRGMPAFSFLPEPQRWQLVLRLRTLAPAANETALIHSAGR